MRLKTRILLCACTLIAVAVLVCCVLILGIVREQMHTDAAAKAEEAFLTARRTISNTDHTDLDADVIDTYMIYKVHDVDSYDVFTLSRDGRYLINNVGFSPDLFMNVNEDYGESNQVIVHVSGKNVLLTGEFVYCSNRRFRLTMVTDLSGIDRDMRTLAWKCAGVGAAITALFLLLTYFLLSASLRPVKKLQSVARRIAGGDYHARIEVKKRDEIGLLAEDLNTMADAVEQSIAELKEQNSRKQQFINDLSHEMKTPVTSLLLNSETLTTRTVSDEDRQRALLRINEQAKWFERLSQKLMQLVMLQGSIELVPSPVRPLLDAAKETVADSLARAQISLTVACGDRSIPMDFDLLRSALVNLIENAIKASEPQSTIELIGADNQIVVRDHGRGIPKEEIERITEPFYMVDRSRSKKLGGSGLGLALVKQIVDAHHADLRIESEVGVGTSILIRFTDAKR